VHAYSLKLRGVELGTAQFTKPRNQILQDGRDKWENQYKNALPVSIQELEPSCNGHDESLAQERLWLHNHQNVSDHHTDGSGANIHQNQNQADRTEA
jgi:hypothetical protein